MIRLPGGEDDDTVRGLKAISEFVDLTEQQVRTLIKRREIPAFKLGGRWRLRKSRWREHLRELEDRALGSTARNAA